MRFRMLEPLLVYDGSSWSAIRAAQQRLVAALLLLEAGRAVPVERLVDELWGERPPPTAAATVRGYAMRLRRLICPAPSCASSSGRSSTGSPSCSRRHVPRPGGQETAQVSDAGHGVIIRRRETADIQRRCHSRIEPWCHSSSKDGTRIRRHGSLRAPAWSVSIVSPLE
jgi:hypothetical protein